MQYIVNPAREDWAEILKRPVFEQKDLESRVQPILDAVKNKGDQALKEFSARFDQVELEEWRVNSAEIEEAIKEIPESLKLASQV